MAEFIFMLTKDDATVADCSAVYDELRTTTLRWAGFKDIGVPVPVLAELCRRMHDDGLRVVLEIVSTDPEAEVRSVEAGLSIGVDMLMGGTNPDRALPLLQGSMIRYCPFPGRVVGHPSILEGSIEEIAASARELTALEGVDGLDLLAYRWQGPVPELISAVVAASRGPVTVAGSVITAEQIRDLTQRRAWGFTIGSAAFDGLLVPGGSIRDQVTWALDAAADAQEMLGPGL
ncbi:MAG: hypothetical protein ACLQT7_06645 [Candidatus Dormibacteria bacterium]